VSARIFVAGTGRSGTTILQKMLGCHRRIYPLRFETRFIVDPDGVYDLANNLTQDYSPIRSREAIYRFDRLMRRYLTEPLNDPYRGYDMAGLCGREFYVSRLDRLLEQLTDFEYAGSDLSAAQADEPRLIQWARAADGWQRKLRGVQRILPMTENPRRRFRHGRYFSQRAELLALLSSYVDDLFGAAAQRAGKDAWCDKTPHNLSHPGFLWEMFPQAYFIHMLRDPRAVARSMMKQPWAPDDAADCGRFVRGIYDAWFDFRAAHELPSDRYLEVRLETLTESPAETLRQITAFCGLADDYGPLPDIRPEHNADWRAGLTDHDRSAIETSLAPYVARLGYGTE
jgi:hypothetical protein